MIWIPAAVPLDADGDSFVVHPGNAPKSSVYDRLNNETPSLHMPPLATSEFNQAAISLIGDWITNDVPARVTYAAWATNYFADTTSAAAAMTADPDGDGLSNEAEYLLGESPLNPVVGWRPQMLAGPQAKPRIRFLRKANRCFTVETLTDLTHATWQPVDIPENAPFYAAADEWVELPLPAGNATGFFRVTVTAAP